MKSHIFYHFFIPLLAFILISINFIFAPHNPYQEKNGAFECGYTSFLGQNRTQFSISFFIFALLFLLFDLEILLVYPYLVSSYNNESYGLAILLVFLLALTLGFVFELGKKALTIDSKQTIQNKDTNIHISKATILPVGLPLSLGAILKYCVEILLIYITNIIIMSDFNKTQPRLANLSIQLATLCFAKLFYNAYDGSYYDELSTITFILILCWISLYVALNEKLKLKYPAIYSDIVLILEICIIITGAYWIYTSFLMNNGKDNLSSGGGSNQGSGSNRGGGPDGGNPNNGGGPDNNIPPHQNNNDNDGVNEADDPAIQHDRNALDGINEANEKLRQLLDLEASQRRVQRDLDNPYLDFEERWRLTNLNRDILNRLQSGLNPSILEEYRRNKQNNESRSESLMRSYKLAIDNCFYEPSGYSRDRNHRYRWGKKGKGNKKDKGNKK